MVGREAGIRFGRPGPAPASPDAGRRPQAPKVAQSIRANARETLQYTSECFGGVGSKVPSCPARQSGINEALWPW